MADRWTSEWQGLRLRVEQREFGANGGPTLHVAAGDADRVWLRFDCFREGPHWHLDPGGRDEVQPLDAAADPVTACLEKLRGELPELLARAGAPDALHAPLAEALASEAGRGLLRDVERALRHRPAVLEELDPRLLEQRRSEKWHTYPPDVLPAWVAEMDFPVAAPIEDELRRFLDRSDLGYPIAPRETGLAEVFRDRMQERFDWSPDPANVEILSEVVQGLYVALLAFARSACGGR